jgi:hypothetical protein
MSVPGFAQTATAVPPGLRRLRALVFAVVFALKVQKLHLALMDRRADRLAQAASVYIDAAGAYLQPAGSRLLSSVLTDDRKPVVEADDQSAKGLTALVIKFVREPPPQVVARQRARLRHFLQCLPNLPGPDGVPTGRGKVHLPPSLVLRFLGAWAGSIGGFAPSGWAISEPEAVALDQARLGNCLRAGSPTLNPLLAFFWVSRVACDRALVETAAILAQRPEASRTLLQSAQVVGLLLVATLADVLQIDPLSVPQLPMPPGQAARVLATYKRYTPSKARAEDAELLRTWLVAAQELSVAEAAKSSEPVPGL